MLYRILFGSALSAGAGVLIFSGAIPLGGAAYSADAYQQEVPATPGQVSTALADIDFRELQMANPTAGYLELQRSQKGNGWSWTFRIDGKHVLDFEAAVEPLEEGVASRVVASAQHGPDHASADLPSGLRDLAGPRRILAGAIEFELNSLVAPDQQLSTADNKKRRNQRMMQAIQAQVMRNPVGIAGDAAKAERDFRAGEHKMDGLIKQADNAAKGWNAAPAQATGKWGSETK